jgi:thiamine pyridinylase
MTCCQRYPKTHRETHRTARRETHCQARPSISRTAALAAALTLAAGCGDNLDPVTPPDAGASPPPPFALRAVVYPYIPNGPDDAEARLATRLEAEFEDEHPEVDVEVNLSWDTDPYDYDDLERWLTSPDPSEAMHVVEVDALMLGDLVERGLVAEWPALPHEADWDPAARDAVTVDGAIYGVPHWLCGHMVISRDPAIAAAGTASALLDALAAGGPDAAGISGTYLGSWNSISLYTDAWADTHGAEDLAASYSGPLEAEIVADMRAIAQTCARDDGNPCLSEEFEEDFDAPARAFLEGEYQATFGYSERLHYIVNEGVQATELHVGSISFGEGSTPVLFADAFVVRKDCTGACWEAARAFIEHATAIDTFRWMLMSEDSPGDAPRYLIPARPGAFEDEVVAGDPLYRQIHDAIEGGAAFPNRGFPVGDEPREQRAESVIQALQAAE